MGLTSAKYLAPTRMDGKTAVITGSNTGIGKITAQDFFKRGARVIMACRNADKATKAAQDIRSSCKNQNNVGELVITELDLSSLESVKKCASYLMNTEKRIDLLINNAGIMACPANKTKDGFELQFGTNHLGHFLLTLLLLPKIAKSTPSRIVNVSSLVHAKGHMEFEDLNFEKRTYSPLKAYFQSKLANVLFTKELARRIQEAQIEGLTVYSLHPGVISTDLGRHFNDSLFWGSRWLFKTAFGMFLKTPEQGAQTTIYCALDETAGAETGLYYAECKVVEPSSEAKNAEKAQKLWEISQKLVGLQDDYNPFI